MSTKNAFIFVILTLTGLLVATFCLGQTVTIGSGGSGTVTYGSGGSGSVSYTLADAGSSCDSTDLGLYFDADSTTDPQTPTILGADDLSISASFSLADPLAGAGSNSVDNDGTGTYQRIRITSSTLNISVSSGVVGFYFVYDTHDADANVFSGKAADSAPRFALKDTGSGGNFTWAYMETDCNQTINLTAGTTYFLELAWDSGASNGWYKRWRTDGGSWTEDTSCTVNEPTLDSAIVWGSNTSIGDTVDGRYDQIFVSNGNPTKDLYAIRDCTSF